MTAATAADTAAWALSNPEVWIEFRGPHTRVRLVRRGAVTAREVRTAGAVTVGLPVPGGGRDWLTKVCAPALAGMGAAGAEWSVAFPTDVVLERRYDAAQLAARLRGGGCAAADAARAASTLLRATVAVEVVFGHHAMRTDRVLALLDTPDGAVLASTAPAADGTRWTSLCAATRDRIGVALWRGCADLPDHGWQP